MRSLTTCAPSCRCMARHGLDWREQFARYGPHAETIMRIEVIWEGSVGAAMGQAWLKLGEQRQLGVCAIPPTRDRRMERMSSPGEATGDSRGACARMARD